jgi:hypothetical protein
VEGVKFFLIDILPYPVEMNLVVFLLTVGLVESHSGFLGFLSFFKKVAPEEPKYVSREDRRIVLPLIGLSIPVVALGVGDSGGVPFVIDTATRLDSIDDRITGDVSRIRLTASESFVPRYGPSSRFFAAVGANRNSAWVSQFPVFTITLDELIVGGFEGFDWISADLIESDQWMFTGFVWASLPVVMTIKSTVEGLEVPSEVYNEIVRRFFGADVVFSVRELSFDGPCEKRFPNVSFTMGSAILTVPLKKISNFNSGRCYVKIRVNPDNLFVLGTWFVEMVNAVQFDHTQSRVRVWLV